MNFIGEAYRAAFYQPVFNLLVFFYNVIPGHDIGLAIIALTVLVRIILLPISARQIHSQRAMQALQPQLKALQEEHKNDKEKLARATMELYSKEKVNPLSSCLPLLIQLPFFLAIYHAMRDGLDPARSPFKLLYSFVANPGTIDVHSFGFINLAVPSIPLAVLAGITQFFQTKMIMPKSASGAGAAPDKSDRMAMMNRQMTYLMPAMTVLIGASLPGGLALYWLLTNVLTIVQQHYFLKKK